VLRLTLLAPDFVEAILGGRQPADLQLEDSLRRFPVGWREQQAKISVTRNVELMTEKQILGFKPVARLEHAGDEHTDRMQARITSL
jgi:hypothetical protein